MTGDATDPILELVGVGRTIDGRTILRDVDWSVRRGQNWAILGPNGSGKTTIARIASLRLHPTTGTVRVLGHELGRSDIRPLLGRVGFAASALADQLRSTLVAIDVVKTAKNGALEPWWHTYDADDESRALEALSRVGVEHVARQTFGSLSSGERQRALIARALMTDPDLIILDEPTAGLDLGGREALVATLDRLAARPDSPPMILITHHVDEIPSSFRHCLLINDGSVQGQGPIDDVLTSNSLTALFTMPLTVGRSGGRWQAWAGNSNSIGPHEEQHAAVD